MNPDTGAIYPDLESALEAGEKAENLVEIDGSPAAVNRATKAIQSDARRKAKRKAQKSSRKRNR